MKQGGLVVTVVAALSATAHADPIDDVVAEGEASARRGDWSVAIDAFRRADLQRPRAKHACLIGLAYSRRELWPQAELYFALCRQRANAADRLPDWLADAEQQLAEKLTATNTVAVSFDVSPSDAVPLLAVSSFAPDEKFAASTIHLVPGTYIVEISAAGFFPVKREVVISASGPRTQAVAVELARRHPAPSRVPYVLVGSGLALAVAGGIVQATALRSARDELSHPDSFTSYYDHLGSFQLRRDVVIGLYTAGGVAVLAGVILGRTVFHRDDVEVAATVTPDRAMLTIGWTR